MLMHESAAEWSPRGFSWAKAVGGYVDGDPIQFKIND